ncbi:hypothetical protein MKQ70_20280 [Chitinophaga sedimenti]|nr:hypothetical protein [Chitinophaga sedimenti]MCK7557216.1 hypothetical protein [Chitinophaga sedimenti]
MLAAKLMATSFSDTGRMVALYSVALTAVKAVTDAFVSASEEAVKPVTASLNLMLISNAPVTEVTAAEITGTGAAVSTSRLKLPLRALVLPAASVTVTSKVLLPSGRAVVTL